MSKKLLVGLVALGALALTQGCNSKAFNESFCASFKESFLKSCTDTCAEKSGQRAACATKCTEALPQQDAYKGRCLDQAK
jgi:hypothetical protein